MGSQGARFLLMAVTHGCVIYGQGQPPHPYLRVINSQETDLVQSPSEERKGSDLFRRGCFLFRYVDLSASRLPCHAFAPEVGCGTVFVWRDSTMPL
ncbi:hypothetical protein LEMLEM_LOCUS6526 [Lemmus lemmus]